MNGEKDTPKTKNGKSRRCRSLELFVLEDMYIEAEIARETGALGYMCRVLTTRSLPPPQWHEVICPVFWHGNCGCCRIEVR
jgi:hypothetical protein